MNEFPLYITVSIWVSAGLAVLSFFVLWLATRDTTPKDWHGGYDTIEDYPDHYGLDDDDKV